MLTLASTFMCFKSLGRRHSTPSNPGRIDELTPVSSSSRRAADTVLTAERVGCRLFLLLQNVGSRAAEYSAQVIAFRDPLGRAIPQQHWTIPARDDLSTSPKLVLVGQTLVFDLACFIREAVEKEIATGQGDTAHWLFSAAPNPIDVRYHNIRSLRDINEQRFRVTIRIMCAGTGTYIDYGLAIGVHGEELACEAVGIQNALPRRPWGWSSLDVICAP